MADPFAGGTCWSVAIGPDCWAAAGAGDPATPSVVTSTDEGVTWTPPAVDPLAGVTGGVGYALVNIAGLIVLGGTSDDNSVTLATSTDGGATWVSPITDPFAGGACSSLSINDDGSVIAAVGFNVDDTVTVAISTDGGTTWLTPAVDPFAGGESVHIAIAPGLLVACAQSAPVSIAVSVDGGATWTSPAVDPFPASLATTVLITTDGVILAGAWANYPSGSGDERLLASADNGATWAPVSGDPAPTDFCNSLAYVGTDTIIAAGQGASGALISTDNGATWASAVAVNSYLAVADAHAIWLAAVGGGDDTVSVDGGTTWGFVTNPLTNFTYAMAAVGDGRVLVGGSNADLTVSVAVLLDFVGPPPANDDRADAVTMDPASGSASYQTVLATDEIVDGELDGSETDGHLLSVWYSFAPASDGHASLSTDDEHTYIEVFAVASTDDPATVDWTDLSVVGGGLATAVVGLRPDEAYAIRLYPTSSGHAVADALFTWEVGAGAGGGGEISTGEIAMTVDAPVTTSPDILTVSIVDETAGEDIQFTIDGGLTVLVEDTVDEDGTWDGGVPLPQLVNGDHYVTVTSGERSGQVGFTVVNDVAYYDDPADPSPPTLPSFVDGEWVL